MKRIIMTMLAVLTLSFAAMAAVNSASFPGGDAAMRQFIKENMKYPETARNNGIEGIIDVAFTVKADGTIGGIKIVRMVDPDLEQEAIRLVKSMPKWTPAIDNGKAVDSQQSVKIDFSLE